MQNPFRLLVLLGLLAASCAAPAVTTASQSPSPTSTVAPATVPQSASPRPTATARPGLITRVASVFRRELAREDVTEDANHMVSGRR